MKYKYKPFTKIEQVESYFGHSIYFQQLYREKEMIVVGANYYDNELYIQAVDEDGKELSMPATRWCVLSKYMGHKFGQEVMK